jgi:hypothetical protein
MLAVLTLIEHMLPSTINKIFIYISYSQGKCEKIVTFKGGEVKVKY